MNTPQTTDLEANGHARSSHPFSPHLSIRSQALFVIASFVLYSIGDGCWQAADDSVNNGDVLKAQMTEVLAKLTRYSLVACAQAIPSWFINEIFARRYKVTTSWKWREVAASWITGFLWQPFVDAGELLGVCMGLAADSSANVTVAAVILFGGNWLTQTLLQMKKIPCQRQHINGLYEPLVGESRADVINPTEHNNENNSMTPLIDSLAALLFYIQGKTAQYDSGVGNRNTYIAGALSGAGAALGAVTQSPLVTGFFGKYWRHIKIICNRSPEPVSALLASKDIAVAAAESAVRSPRLNASQPRNDNFG